MFKSKIIDEIIAWKNSTGKKKALVKAVMGSVGKLLVVI